MADISGGAELILGSHATKETVSMRVQHTEIGFAPTRPTLVHMGALAALQGVEMKRVSQKSRYIAARLAMVREAATDGEVQLNKVKSEHNLEDIFTKPLQGETFRRLRAIVLGMDTRATQP